MGLFLYRLMGAATLDSGMYESVETDRRTTIQAAAVVVLAAIAAGIGAGGPFGFKPRVFLGVTAIGLIAWAAWAVLIFNIGTRWLRQPQTSVSIAELLRTTGFAASPGLLQAAGAFSSATTIIFVISWLWMLVAMVVAVKHALDFRSIGRAAAVCVFAAALCVAVAAGIGIVFGPSVS